MRYELVLRCCHSPKFNAKCEKYVSIPHEHPVGSESDISQVASTRGWKIDWDPRAKEAPTFLGQGLYECPSCQKYAKALNYARHAFERHGEKYSQVMDFPLTEKPRGRWGD